MEQNATVWAYILPSKNFVSPLDGKCSKSIPLIDLLQL